MAWPKLSNGVVSGYSSKLRGSFCLYELLQQCVNGGSWVLLPDMPWSVRYHHNLGVYTHSDHGQCMVRPC